MAGELYLIDSNVLIRWVQPNDPGFPIADAALDRLLLSNADLCYVSQNLGEFWNALTRPANRNGYGFSPMEANRCAISVESRFRLLPDSLAVHDEWLACWWIIASQVCRCTMQGWLPPCVFMA